STRASTEYASLSAAEIRCASAEESRAAATDLTYFRKALTVGTRPAEVCGCERYPSVARSAITLRIDAGLRVFPLRRAIVFEPTGSPVSIYSRTIACRIS